MKGITHCVAGILTASFVPEAVRAAAEGNPLYFVLGAVAGLLPDTIDFKFVRFLAPHDVEIIPDPLRPDARMIADAVAGAVNRVAEIGRPLRVKFSAVQTGGSAWQPYAVSFDSARRRIRATCGRARDAEGIGGAKTEAATPLPCPVAVEYTATIEVDMFDGPLLHFLPDADGRVRIRFLPWHRWWTHSLTMAAALGVAAWAVWGIWAGVVAGLAAAAHVALDQLGLMGSNLWFPFSRRRTPGLQWQESGDTFANFAMIWTASLLLLWNLSRLTPGYGIPRLSLPPLLVYGALLPLAGIAVCRRLLRKRSQVPSSRF